MVSLGLTAGTDPQSRGWPPRAPAPPRSTGSGTPQTLPARRRPAHRGQPGSHVDGRVLAGLKQGGAHAGWKPRGESDTIARSKCEATAFHSSSASRALWLWRTGYAGGLRRPGGVLRRAGRRAPGARGSAAAATASAGGSSPRRPGQPSSAWQLQQRRRGHWFRGGLSAGGAGRKGWQEGCRLSLPAKLGSMHVEASRGQPLLLGPAPRGKQRRTSRVALAAGPHPGQAAGLRSLASATAPAVEVVSLHGWGGAAETWGRSTALRRVLAAQPGGRWQRALQRLSAALGPGRRLQLLGPLSKLTWNGPARRQGRQWSRHNLSARRPRPPSLPSKLTSPNWSDAVYRQPVLVAPLRACEGPYPLAVPMTVNLAFYSCQSTSVHGWPAGWCGSRGPHPPLGCRCHGPLPDGGPEHDPTKGAVLAACTGRPPPPRPPPPTCRLRPLPPSSHRYHRRVPHADAWCTAAPLCYNPLLCEPSGGGLEVDLP